MKRTHSGTCRFLLLGGLSLTLIVGRSVSAQASGQPLQIAIASSDGSYTIGTPGASHATLHAGIAVQLDGRWMESSKYPRHVVKTAMVSDDLGNAKEWAVTFSGLNGEPDLTYHLRAYPDKPYADIRVVVHNSTAKPVSVQSIRTVAAVGKSILDLNAPAARDRVLSDSFSEDRPNITIHDLGDAKDGMHRGVGSQLIYNQQSQESLFLGALTSDRFVTILRVHVNSNTTDPQISAFEVDSTGTTELETDQWGSLSRADPEDKLPLELTVAPGAKLSSERLLLSLNKDYHQQLDTYGSLIRQLHHARVKATTPIGWWSWTAYYFGLNEGTALTNAQWEAQHLKALGYDFFHIDEGYQYARGEYSTPDARVFPQGLAGMERQVTNLGLVPGIWTAPFEVSERSWVYQNHPDWLVQNAKGKPIHIGWVTHHNDRLFVLDCTNPGAQQYLQRTYSTLVHAWGIRYIKMDFMDDSAVEGHYYRPNTTAMEAQQTGLRIIRKTVGDHVLLDKDGSVMLNPVGYVDFGRISQDTGHTFSSSKDAATGIAARYYMNRTFFVSDPDAFSVSAQTVSDQSWHGGQRPLTADEARVSIALSAVSGGMYEIGDDLPTLGAEPERLALVQNIDLISMARLGHASTPIDLMTYLPQDEQPSIFLLRESPRQNILSIFNWTDGPRTHSIQLPTLGLSAKGTYSISDVFDQKPISALDTSTLQVHQPAHSVRMFKIIDTAIPAQAPSVHAQHASSGKAGETLTFSANSEDSKTPTLSYQWDFGDGVSLEGMHVMHAYTHAGTYQVKVVAMGLDGRNGEDSFPLTVSGSISTRFSPAENRRYHTNP
ncbi:MAG TPA: alpha-galactosidase [Acidobacteriaceae bacterium]|nr:alpha-galactosidase [Acidobacteriaceae bacterium]